jgi:hypothetical protein
VTSEQLPSDCPRYGQDHAEAGSVKFVGVIGETNLGGYAGETSVAHAGTITHGRARAFGVGVGGCSDEATRSIHPTGVLIRAQACSTQPAASLVAADVVRAEVARAFVCAGAGGAIGLLQDAATGRAVVTGEAIRICSADGLARACATDEGRAIDGAIVDAHAGPIACVGIALDFHRARRCNANRTG